VRLVSFTESDQKPRPGALQGDRVVDLSDQLGDIRELIEGGPELQHSVYEFLGFLGKAHSQFSPTQVSLLPPILNPPRIFCLDRNSSGDTEGSYYLPEAPVSTERPAFGGGVAKTHPTARL